MAHVYQNINIGNRLDVIPGGHVITTAKGQLIADNGSETVVQPAASTDGFVLIADSSQATGMRWDQFIVNLNGSDTIIYDTNTLYVNSSSTSGQVLQSAGTVGVEAVYGAVDLTNSNSVTGVLPFANGGTGASSYTAGDRLIATNTANDTLVATGINPADIVVPQTATLQTTNATQQNISTIATTSDTLYYVTAVFIARNTATPTSVASFRVTATLNNVAGTLTLIGLNDIVYLPNTTTWMANIAASGTDIVFQVTGAAATTIDWKVTIEPPITL